MPITDSANSIYMNNMYVSGGNANANNTQTAQNAAAVAGAADTSSGNSLGITNETFTELLKNMMLMSATSIGGFSDSDSGSSSSLGDLSGLGSGLTGLGGSGSEMSMIMMLLMFMLIDENSSGQNTNLLNTMMGGYTNNGAADTSTQTQLAAQQAYTQYAAAYGQTL